MCDSFSCGSFTGNLSHNVPPKGGPKGLYSHGGAHGKVTSVKTYFGSGGKCNGDHVLEAIHVAFDYGITIKEYGSPGFCKLQQDIFCQVDLDPGEFFNYVIVSHYEFVTRLEFHSNFREFFLRSTAQCDFCFRVFRANLEVWVRRLRV